MKMITTITLSLLVLGFAPLAQAGYVSPGLESQMADLKGDDTIKVLVVMSEQTDIKALDWNLHNAKSTFATRHRSASSSMASSSAELAWRRSRTMLLTSKAIIRPSLTLVSKLTAASLLTSISASRCDNHQRAAQRRTSSPNPGRPSRAPPASGAKVSSAVGEGDQLASEGRGGDPLAPEAARPRVPPPRQRAVRPLPQGQRREAARRRHAPAVPR